MAQITAILNSLENKTIKLHSVESIGNHNVIKVPINSIRLPTEAVKVVL